MTIHDIRSRAQNSSYGDGHERIIRRISPYFSWLLLNLRFNSNQVTLLGVVIGLAGASVFLADDGLTFWYLAPISIIIATILDHSDGEVARYQKKPSITGLFVDRLYPVIVQPLTFIFIAIYLFKSQELNLSSFVVVILLSWLSNLPRILNAYVALCLLDAFYRPKKVGGGETDTKLNVDFGKYESDLTNKIVVGDNQDLKSKLLYIIAFFFIKPIGMAIYLTIIMVLVTNNIEIINYNPLVIYLSSYVLIYGLSSIVNIFSVIKNNRPDSIYNQVVSIESK